MLFSNYIKLKEYASRSPTDFHDSILYHYLQALSGFHAIQSPIISRTVQKESQRRYVFYVMMIAEAVIAMIWAAATISMLDGQTLNEFINTGTPSAVVNGVSMTLLGAFGGKIAVLSAIVQPIISGDTVFRAARSIIAGYLQVDQKQLKNAYGSRFLYLL